jgi:threonine 3-dehydrogenase
VRALVKSDSQPGLVLCDVREDPLGREDARIRVLRTGLCGTDLHIASWDRWAQQAITPPLIVGHEFVGEVVEIGADVHEIAVGDLVSGEGHLVCGRCRNCRAGRRHLCIRTIGVGVNRAGAFAEFITLPQTNVWVHRAPIDLDIAAIFDPFGNAVHTALSFSVHNEDVLITGAGPIGVMAAAIARHAGARSVVVTDLSPYRLELAKRLGATATVNIKEQALAEILPSNHIVEGFDVALEMSGRSNALNDAVSTLRAGGKMALLGLPPEPVSLNLAAVVTKMLTLQGIYGREMFETWYAMSVLLEGGLDISPVITHRFGYQDYQTAFDVARSGECGKVVIDWTTDTLA